VTSQLGTGMSLTLFYSVVYSVARSNRAKQSQTADLVKYLKTLVFVCLIRLQLAVCVWGRNNE
jgi:hypothetical protein